MCETDNTMVLCYYFYLYMIRGFTENPFRTKTLQLQINAAMFSKGQTSTITLKKNYMNKDFQSLTYTQRKTIYPQHNKFTI